nr:site-specific integrase [Deefgea sp. CFH1-16]
MEIMQQVVSTKEGATTFWLGKNETASRVRGRIEVILDFAKFSKFCEGDNPASWKGNLAMALPKPSKVHTVEHHPALPLSELGPFLHELRQRPGTSARLLEFIILTAARSGEARGALWSEIDLEKKTWVVPAKRMKNNKIHTVPLNEALIGILNSMPRIDGNPLIFPAPRGKVASDSIFKALFLRMKRSDFTTHGFRSTFKDWARTCTGNKYADEVTELALSHVDSDATRAAYARNELLEYRRELMDEWTEFCA